MAEQREITVNACDCNECMGCLDLAPDIFDWDTILYCTDGSYLNHLFPMECENV